jgi:phospholipase/carboxylesterase
MPVTINGGYVMRAWYDILGADLVRREDERGVRASHARVEALIEREVERGMPRARIVLAGFSQGGAITLHTGLRQREPLAGLVALSCYLPLADAFAGEADSGSARVPIFLAHGTSDPVVPIDRGRASRDVLKAAGYPVEWHEYAMPHSVCTEEIRDIAAFLQRVLA